MRRSTCGFLAAMVIVLSGNLFAAPATNPADTQKSYAADINAAIKLFDSKREWEPQAGEVKLSLIPLDGFPQIEAAAQQPGLSATATEHLKRFIAKQAPWQTARQHMAVERAAERKGNLDSALAAYDAVGSKNPKWDADVKKAIELFVDNKFPRDLLAKAIEAGCDDPFVLYLAARSQPVENDDVVRLYEAATAAFEKSKYPADRKVRCYAWNFAVKVRLETPKLPPGSNFPDPVGRELGHLADITRQVLPEIAGEKMHRWTLLELTEVMFNDFYSDHKGMFDALYPALEKSGMDESTLLAIKGKFYIKYAWDARGNGWANSVTEQGWKGMKDRLDIAADALTKAWEKDNTNYQAATDMLKVELGQGMGRDRMELWFKRAMDANPENYAACHAKMYYLEPKWYGTPADMIIFGRQCAEQMDWPGDLPIMLVDAHHTLAGYMQNASQYYEQPLVWHDIQSVYVPYLIARPDNAYMRGIYCRYACLCGKWTIAKQQFDRLGEKADPGSFDGADNMRRFRQEAEEKGTSAATP